jgi:hypothetical protein
MYTRYGRIWKQIFQKANRQILDNCLQFPHECNIHYHILQNAVGGRGPVDKYCT